VPYYMNQMNEWLRTFSQKFNDILTGGFAEDNEPGVMLFTSNYATSDEQYDFPGDTRYDTESYEAYLGRVQSLMDGGMSEADAKAAAVLTVTSTEDSYYQMTALNFDILSAIEVDPGRLANKNNSGDGVEQSDLLEELKNLATDKDMMSFRGCSSSEFLQCVLSDIALNTQRANTLSKSYQDIAAAIDTRRISISGVDEDEEAVNLVKFQNGYNLASKMIQTLTEIYDRLILETGV